MRLILKFPVIMDIHIISCHFKAVTQACDTFIPTMIGQFKMLLEFIGSCAMS
jgi:hypothetical protein